MPCRIGPSMKISIPVLALLFTALLTAPPAVSDAIDVPVPAKVQVLKAGKLGKFVSKPAVKGTTFAVPVSGGPSDPTVHGGSMKWCRLGAPVGCQSFALVAAGWEGLGNPAGTKGWKYKGRGDATDPCKAVLVKPGVCARRASGRTLQYRLGRPGPRSSWFSVRIATAANRPWRRRPR